MRFRGLIAKYSMKIKGFSVERFFVFGGFRLRVLSYSIKNVTQRDQYKCKDCATLGLNFVDMYTKIDRER